MQNPTDLLLNLIQNSATLQKNPIQQKMLMNKMRSFNEDEKSKLVQLFLKEKHDINHIRSHSKNNYASLQGKLNFKFQQISQVIEKDIIQKKNQNQKRMDEDEADKILEELD